MTLKRTGAKIGVSIVTLAMAATACGGSSGGGTTTNNGSGDGKAGVTGGTPGGTLTIPMFADFEHLDPARNYVANALNFSRLLVRTLTTYKSVPGAEGTDIVGDLATDTGTATDGGKTWKFTLKDGVKYEDGSAITSQDIKYSVERTMSPSLPEGPQYAKLFLEGAESYKGPFAKDGGKELDSIQTPDAKTIIFKLKQPVGDFNFLAAFPSFGGIPKAKDTGTSYDNRPFSSGPYKIEKYSRGKSLTLVRNTNWDKSTDKVRAALPDRIEAQFGVDPGTIDQRILSASGKDAAAVQLDSSIQPENVAKVQGAQYKNRTMTGFTGFVRYYSPNASKAPFDKLEARQALEYCTDKEGQQTARGGPSAAGEIATHVLVPTVKGYEEFNPYPTASPKGDVEQGKKLLAKAGLKAPIKITIQTNDSPKGQKQATSLQDSLKRCGFDPSVQVIPATTYYTTVGDPSKQGNIVFAAWGPDWPSASTVIPPLFDSRQIKSQGNQVFANHKNLPVAKELDAEMDRIQAMTDADAAAGEWSKLDKKIMENALIVPLLIDKAIYINGTNVKNAFVHAFFGEADMVALGVK